MEKQIQTPNPNSLPNQENEEIKKLENPKPLPEEKEVIFHSIESEINENSFDGDDEQDTLPSNQIIQPKPKRKHKGGRRKIEIEYITEKSRRHITFSKRKGGLMKKAYELSTLTGTEMIVLIASETGHVYTFATPKLQPLVTNPEGKALIQTCLNQNEIEDDIIIPNFHEPQFEQNLLPGSHGICQTSSEEVQRFALSLQQQQEEQYQILSQQRIHEEQEQFVDVSKQPTVESFGEIEKK
eukprot:gene6705-10870_t